MKSSGSPRPSSKTACPACVLPKAPCPGRPNLSPPPDTTSAFKKKFHAPTSGSAVRGGSETSRSSPMARKLPGSQRPPLHVRLAATTASMSPRGRTPLLAVAGVKKSARTASSSSDMTTPREAISRSAKRSGGSGSAALGSGRYSGGCAAFERRTASAQVDPARAVTAGETSAACRAGIRRLLDGTSCSAVVAPRRQLVASTDIAGCSPTPSVPLRTTDESQVGLRCLLRSWHSSRGRGRRRVKAQTSGLGSAARLALLKSHLMRGPVSRSRPLVGGL